MNGNAHPADDQTGGSAQERGVVKSAARALDILEFLLQFPRGLSLSEIGRDLDIPLSSLHSLIETLILKGYLIRDDSGSNYRLSSKLVQLAGTYHAQNDLISISNPIMDNLCKLTRETASLAILHETVIVFINKRSYPNLLQVVNPVGTRLPAHATGLGKVMLAHLDDADIDRLYPQENLVRLTDATIATRTELKAELKRTRERGYAFDDGESNPDIWAVASAIRNRYGFPVAALSVAAPFSRVRGRDVAEWHEATRWSAQEISQTLGFAT